MLCASTFCGVEAALVRARGTGAGAACPVARGPPPARSRGPARSWPPTRRRGPPPRRPARGATPGGPVRRPARRPSPRGRGQPEGDGPGAWSAARAATQTPRTAGRGGVTGGWPRQAGGQAQQGTGGAVVHRPVTKTSVNPLPYRVAVRPSPSASGALPLLWGPHGGWSRVPFPRRAYRVESVEEARAWPARRQARRPPCASSACPRPPGRAPPLAQRRQAVHSLLRREVLEGGRGHPPGGCRPPHAGTSRTPVRAGACRQRAGSQASSSVAWARTRCRRLRRVSASSGARAPSSSVSTRSSGPSIRVSR